MLSFQCLYPSMTLFMVYWRSEFMEKRRNTRINTMFSENTFDWIEQQTEERGQSLAQTVRDKVNVAKREEEIFDRLNHLEKVIKKSHSLIIHKLDGDSNE